MPVELDSELDRLEVARQADLEATLAAANGALGSVNIFVDSSAGLAGTASGAYFSVPSPESTEYLILYRNNGGVAEETKRYPSEEAVTALQDLPGRVSVVEIPYTSTAFSPSASRAKTGLFSTGLDCGYAWSLGEIASPFDYVLLDFSSLAGLDTINVSVFRRLLSAVDSNTGPGLLGTDIAVQTKAFDVADLQPGPDIGPVRLVLDTPVDPISGYITIIKVVALLADGVTPGVMSLGRAADGAVVDQSTAGWYFRISVYPASSVNADQLRTAYEIGSSYKALPDYAPAAVADVVAAQGDILAEMTGLLTEQIEVPAFIRTPNVSFAPGSFTAWACGFNTDAGLVKYLRIPGASGLSVVASMQLMIYRRLSSYVGTPGSAGDTLVYSREYSAAELSIAGNTGDLLFDLGAGIETVGGESILWTISAKKADTTAAQFGLSYNNADAASVQLHKGYFKTTGSWSSVTTAGAALAFSMGDYGLSVDPSIVAAPPSFDLLDGVDVTVSVDETTVDVSGSVYVNGSATAFSASQAITLPAVGSERFDRISINKSTHALVYTAGTARTGIDGIEYIPAIPTGCIPVAIVMANTALHACSSAEFDGLVKIGSEGERARLIARNRMALRSTIGKLRRGAAIELAAYGDSIDAIQNLSGLGSMPYTANGINRDRPEYYFTNYASDTLAAIPKFDFGDGAGTAHCKVGRAWRLVEHLEESYGSTVTYLNFGIGSTNSGTSEHHGRWPARLAEIVSAAPDLAIVSFGMNELGSTSTFTNVVAIAQALQAVGSEVVIQGVPRINAAHATAVATWRYTNAELERAAIAVGAAYVPTTWIADDRNLGGIGAPSEALCSANKGSGNNHPGIYELARYGEHLVQMTGL